MRQKMEVKLFPQNRHRETDSRNSSTTQLWAEDGSQLGVEAGMQLDKGRKALRVHPMHVLTFGVDKMNVVTEQRPE
jgi:hypothetical protein